MKKIFILLLLLLTGCTNLKNDKYTLYLKELKDSKESTELKNYNINISFDKYSDDEVVYQVVVDNAKEILSNIQVLIYHDQETNDIYPSIGLFNDYYNLVPDSIVKDNINIHGINLVGYIPFNKPINEFKAEVKVLVIYNLNNQINKDFYIHNFDNNNN